MGVMIINLTPSIYVAFLIRIFWGLIQMTNDLQFQNKWSGTEILIRDNIFLFLTILISVITKRFTFKLRFYSFIFTSFQVFVHTYHFTMFSLCKCVCVCGIVCVCMYHKLVITISVFPEFSNILLFWIRFYKKIVFHQRAITIE